MCTDFAIYLDNIFQVEKRYPAAGKGHIDYELF